MSTGTPGSGYLRAVTSTWTRIRRSPPGREAVDELGIDPGGRLIREPLFLSAAVTVGVDSGHTDVSLWCLLSLCRDDGLRVDRAEFRTVR